MIGPLLVAALLLQDSGGRLQNGSNYIAKAPNGYNAGKKWPLLVVLHGNGDKAENFIRNFEMPEVRNRFILIAVNSKSGSWEGEEMAAIVEATDLACKSFSVDPDAIWLSGFSGGAMMGAHTAMFKWPKYAGFVDHSNGATSYPPNLADLKSIYAYIRCGTGDPIQLKSAQELNAKLKEAGCTNVKYEEVKGMGHTFTAADAKIGVAWIGSILDKNAPRDPMKLKITFSGLEKEEKKLQEAAAIVWNATQGLVQIEKFEEAAKGGDVKGPAEPAEIAKTILQAKLGVALEGEALSEKEFEKLLKKLSATKPRKAPPAAPEAKIAFKK